MKKFIERHVDDMHKNGDDFNGESVMKFKVGDKVRVIADHARLIEIGLGPEIFGKEYEIFNVGGDFKWAKYQLPYDVFGDGTEKDYPIHFAEQDLELVESESAQTEKPNTIEISILPVGRADYMSLSDAYDNHSRNLMEIKGEEYSLDKDFLAMENRLAGMCGSTPEKVSLIMAGKHVTSLGIILDKNEAMKISLKKWDERVRDAINLLKITSAFIHAKQNDFSLHLDNSDLNIAPYNTKTGLCPDCDIKMREAKNGDLVMLCKDCSRTKPIAGGY